MKLKTALGEIEFTFNNFYNSKPWYLMVRNDIERYMRIKYGHREILDQFLDGDDNLRDRGELADCIDLTLMSNTWKYDHLYSIYSAEYNPIWNYEGTETKELERTLNDSHKGTDTLADSGTDTTTRTGSISNAKTGHDDLTRSGSTSHGKTGTETGVETGSITHQNSGSVQNARTTFDSSTALDTDKTTDTTSTTDTFNNHQNQETYNTTETESFNNRKDQTSYNSTETQTFQSVADATVHGKTETTTYSSGHDIIEHSKETMTRGGNMGVTSTQDMATQEIELAGKLDLLNTIALDIVNSICYS